MTTHNHLKLNVPNTHEQEHEIFKNFQIGVAAHPKIKRVKAHLIK